jgi:hypothetical protein
MLLMLWPMLQLQLRMPNNLYQAVRMKDKVLFIGLPLALLVVILMHWFAIKIYGLPDKTEAFADVPNLSSCPDDLSRYSDGKAINCCEGKVTGGRCSGKPRCSLSGTSGLPRCADYLLATGKDKATRFCPKSLPNYYSVDGKGFCTSSAIKSDGSGPVEKITNPGMRCAVLSNLDEREINPESCYNRRRLDEFKVTITNEPVRRILEPGRKLNNGSIIPTRFMAIYGKAPKYNSCVDRSSTESWLDVVFSGWRSGNNENYNKEWADVIWCN